MKVFNSKFNAGIQIFYTQKLINYAHATLHSIVFDVCWWCYANMIHSSTLPIWYPWVLFTLFWKEWSHKIPSQVWESNTQSSLSSPPPPHLAPPHGHDDVYECWTVIRNTNKSMTFIRVALRIHRHNFEENQRPNFDI
jgi:hypothetical protein